MMGPHPPPRGGIRDEIGILARLAPRFGYISLLTGKIEGGTSGRGRKLGKNAQDDLCYYKSGQDRNDQQEEIRPVGTGGQLSPAVSRRNRWEPTQQIPPRPISGVVAAGLLFGAQRSKRIRLNRLFPSE